MIVWISSNSSGEKAQRCREDKSNFIRNAHFDHADHHRVDVGGEDAEGQRQDHRERFEDDVERVQHTLPRHHPPADERPRCGEA